MKFDKYNRIARIYPSLIILIPFLIFTLNCNISNLETIFENILQLKIVGNITISVVLLFFFTQINRLLGKFLFERYLFSNELEMPTTNFLLYTNSEFSTDYKNQLRNQISNDFNIKLPSENDEIKDIINARKMIVESVGLIRQRVKNGNLLLQHNIEYGFFRNLIGGSIIGFLMSAFDTFYFHINNSIALSWLCLCLALLFLTLILIHKPVIRYLGNLYAKRLFQEYLQK